MNSDVAVVGMACVFPRANDLQEYWSNLVNGVDCLGLPPPGRWGEGDGPGGVPQALVQLLPHLRGGFLRSDLRLDLMRFNIIPKVAQGGEPEQMLMIHVIDEALRDAGVADDHPIRQRSDVILGRGGYINYRIGEFFFKVELMTRLQESMRRAFPHIPEQHLRDFIESIQGDRLIEDPDHLPALIPNLVASRAANRLNLRGEACVIDAACASSLIAVEQSVQRLRTGRCDLAVAGGIHLCQIPAFWKVFHVLQALSPSGQIRPFDRRADGLLLGEGAGAVILKRLDDARRDGDRIYAIVKGVGASSDGRETSLLAPGVAGQVLALERAYQDAGVERNTIGFLEAHGTATVVGDAVELQTIRAFFGEDLQPSCARAMGSVKGNIGHTMPAAGMASFIKVALCLANKMWTPSLHCEEPRAEAASLAFFMNTQTRPWLQPRKNGPRRAGVNSFGFGGINVHAVLEEAPADAASGLKARPPQPGLRRPSEVFVVSARAPEDLAARVARVATFCARDPSTPLADLAFTLNQELDAGQPCKLALVAADRAALEASLAKTQQGLRDRTLRSDEASGVFYSANAAQPPGKIALLFPGMAFPGLIGNYPQHLIDLAMHFPELRAELDKFEGKDGHPDDPFPFSVILSPPPCLPESCRAQLKQRLAPPRTLDEQVIPEPAPGERNLAGVGVVISNWTGWTLLRQLQIPVDITCGHSAGELTALCASGLLDFDAQVLPKIWTGLAVDPRWMARGCLAYVNLTEEDLQPHLARHRETQIAVHVAPDSQVVGGPKQEIDQLVRELRRQGVMAQSLPFVPGHTARMSFLREQMMVYAIDDDQRIGQPTATAFSSLTARPYPTDLVGLRDLLLGNLDRPVLFWQTNQRLYEEGVRIFVQVGCGTIAANVKSSLPWPDVIATAIDVEYRDPITQFNNLCATLFTAGVPLNFELLYRARTPRLLNLDETVAPEPLTSDVPLDLRLRLFMNPAPAAAKAEPKAAVAPPEPAAGVAESASRLPFLGSVLYFVPEREILVERVVSLDEDLYLQDHHFLEGRDFKPLEECFPVVPMMAGLEMMAETAAFLAPGLGLVGFEEVRNLRWMALEGRRAITLQFRVRRLPASEGRDEVCRLQAEILCGGHSHATARVLFAPRYVAAVEEPQAELHDPVPYDSPADATELYERGFTFHGPRFRCVSQVGLHADNGFAGALTVRPRHDLFRSQPHPDLLFDFCTCDGTGQLFGLWLQVRDMTAFPLSIEKIDIAQDVPAPGSKISISGRVHDVNGLLRIATADMELRDDSGQIWMRIHGWTDWIQTRSRSLIDFQRLPKEKLLASPLTLPAAGPETAAVHLSAKGWTDITMHFLAHLSLSSTELVEYGALNLAAQRTFLLGRIAAKDAARLWLFRHTGKHEIHPLALEIVKDERGQPYLEDLGTGTGMSLPAISIAHTAEHAVALACPGAGGIDVELLSRDVQPILAEFATDEEVALLRAQQEVSPDEPWALMLWCAKEALGKALGIGLNGRPKDFNLRHIVDNETLTLHYGPAARDYTVHTGCHDGCLLAHTQIDNEWRRHVPVAARADRGR